MKSTDAGKQQQPEASSKKKKKSAKDVMTPATTSPSTATSTSNTTAKQQQRSGEQMLDPDSLKSRNHSLFLAPSGASSSKQHQLSWGHFRKESATHSVTERLHTEILEYAQYTRSTVEDMAVHIELMITNVRTCVQSLWPRSNVETFGSYSTGIWLPSSDVDLVILVRARLLSSV